MKPIEYRGSLTREQFLFYETRIVAKKILEDKNEEEVVKEIIADNLFQFPTEKNIKSIAKGCYRRLKSTNNMNLVALVADASADIGKQAALYALMCYNAVVYDFMVDVIGEKYRTQDLVFDKSCVTRFCSELRNKDEKVSEWSDATMNKIRQVLLKTLVDTGYLNSISSKELNPVYLYEEVLECINDNGDQEIYPAFNHLG